MSTRSVTKAFQTVRTNSTYSQLIQRFVTSLKNGTRPKKIGTNGLQKPLIIRKSESLTLTVCLLLTQSVASVEAPWPCSGFHRWGECSLIINAGEVEKLCWYLEKKIRTSLDFGGKKENENLDVKSCMVWFWVLNKNLVLTTLNG